MKFPTGYEWLGEIGVLPKVVQEGLKLLGTVETPGKANNPVIMAWAKYVNATSETPLGYTADAIPWCGLFIAYLIKLTGRDPVGAPLWARNWAKFGVIADYASLGDILTFVRDGGGHVGLYICEDDLHYYVLGGNQSDAVTITKIKKARCIAVTRPEYKNRPASAKPYWRSIAGKVSTNEK